MKPNISVACITARPGGLDVLLTGLKHQTFREFELVLVDAVYHRRAQLVQDMATDARVAVRHTPPRVRLFPQDACPEARNTAIVKAQGELLLWVVDYAYLPPTCLEAHWRLYEGSGRQVAGSGATQYLFPPQPAYPLPEYAPMLRFPHGGTKTVTYEYVPEDSRMFAADLAAGVYDPFMYSVFAEPLTTPEQILALNEDPLFYKADPKLWGETGGRMFGNYFHAKTESLERDLCLKLNGFDETYTGHLYDDTDFGWRVDHVVGEGNGWVLLEQHDGMIKIVNPRHLFPHLVRRAGTEEHRDYYEKRRTDPQVVTAGNAYNLADLAALGAWWY